MFEPREYQHKMVNDIRQAIREGHKRVIAQAWVGAGKTIISAEIMRLAKNNFKYSLFLAPRRQLVYQAAETFRSYDLSTGIIMAGEPRSSMPFVQVGSVDTITRRMSDGKIQLPKADILIVDECFTGETLVKTPKGDVRIDNLYPGETILNCLGETTILSIFSKPVYQLLKIRLSNGTTINCTKDHPFFTDYGWEAAGTLELGQVLFSEERMCDLWERDDPIQTDEWKMERLCRGRDIFQHKEMLRWLLCKEIEKPDAQFGLKGKNERNINKNWTQTQASGREWTRINRYSKKMVRCIREWMGLRIYTENLKKAYRWLSISLQNRFSKPFSNDSNRARWFQSLFYKKTGFGQKKRCSLEVIRVESIETNECPSGTTVYNLRVKNHPSYYANGVLVHNCHAMMSPKRLELFSHYPLVIGFTSTPALANGRGMGSFYTKIVEGPSMKCMVDNKFLVPMRYFAADAPDLSAVKLNSDGDYQESALAEASDKPQLIGSIYDNYKRIAGDRPTLIFAVNCAHGRHIYQEFVKRGVKADYIDGDTSTEDRDAIKLRVFRGETKVVVNILVMAFGTDWAPFACVIIARATKNLSAWIQMIGRGSRTYPGKQECLVIYHGANFEELGAIDEPITWSLDDKTTIKERKEAAKKERQEPKDIACRECGRVFKGSRICPRCGHEMIPHGESIPVHKADLVEIVDKKVTPEQKKQFYAELLGYCRRYNKPDKMALAIFRKRFKEWPYGKYSVNPIAPSPKTMQYVTSCNIAYAKRKEKERT